MTKSFNIPCQSITGKKIHKGKNEIIFSIAILVTMPFITEEKKPGFKKHLEK